MADASTIIYTAIPLSYISVIAGQNLDTILSNINTAVNAMSSAPNYSGYNLYCVKETDGTTHPTNTQNFAEGISLMLCNLITSFTTFTGTTYPTDQAAIVSAINALDVPAITYAPFSITDTDTVTQVFNKNFTGIGTILSAINPSGASWSSLSITPPTTITTGFTDIINYIVTMNSTIAGKQAQIATFNNTANVLAGGATDSIYTTVGEIITYITTLPLFNNGSITYGGVSAGTNLQSAVQNTISSVSSILQNGVFGQGTGLTIGSIGSTYQGKKLTIDTTYTQLYKAMVTGDAYTDADFLDQKIESSDNSLTLSVTGNKLDIVITAPSDVDKVKINNSDPTGSYLSSKIRGVGNEWGMSNIPIVDISNSFMEIKPELDPNVMFSQMLTYISTNPILFTQFQQLVSQTQGGTCTAPTALSVVLTTGDFALTWTPSGSASSQNVKWRGLGASIWQIGTFITPANPQTTGQSTATVSGSVGVNIPVQFAIDSVCAGGGVGISNVYEMIKYVSTSGSFISSVSGGVISVTQDPLSNIDNVFYRLKNAVPTVIQNITTTGVSPTGSFTSVEAGTYSVEYRFGTLINGVTLYSDDSTQIGSWIHIAGIVVT